MKPKEMPLPSRPLRLRRIARRVLFIVAAWLTGHLVILFWVGFADDVRPSDVAVVLGNGVNADGSPGEVLQPRLDRAVELYRDKLCRNIIVSGSAGQDGYNEPAGMRRYLLDHGVPDEAIVVDAGGINTFHTAVNARQIMRQRGWRSVIIVSQYYHILRIRLAFHRVGLGKVSSAHALYDWRWKDGWRLARDMAGFYPYMFRSYPSQ
jgi:vancomycin permeability regulator SanA